MGSATLAMLGVTVSCLVAICELLTGHNITLQNKNSVGDSKLIFPAVSTHLGCYDYLQLQLSTAFKLQ